MLMANINRGGGHPSPFLKEIDMSHSSDIIPKFISDENASDPDRLVTAARPDTSATMAETTFAGGGARNVTVTTTGTG
jgi:hypothetical protein